MARWVRRMHALNDPRRARIQFENWLRNIGCGAYSYTTVLRVARHLELLGICPDGPKWEPYVPALGAELRRLKVDDLNNPIVVELNRRFSAGQGRPLPWQTPPSPPMTLDEYVASGDRPVMDNLATSTYTNSAYRGLSAAASASAVTHTPDPDALSRKRPCGFAPWCPTCGGTGRDPIDDNEKCPACDGRGRP